MATLLAAACGGGGEPNAGLTDPSQLDGRSVAVPSSSGAPAFQIRYVLLEGYGLQAAREGADVMLVEAPGDSLEELLEEREVDAVVPSDQVAFRLADDERFEVLSHVSREMSDLTGAPVIESVLLTYADVREQKAEALGEVNRLFAESVTYFKTNQDEVTEAVAGQQGTDSEFLDWWWERHDLLFGQATTEFQRGLVAVWEAGIVLGELETQPPLDAVLFHDSMDGLEETADGERITVSVAVQDDVAHRAALYAIDQSIVTSDTVDLDLTYLPLSSLTEAAPAKQYDVIETTPLAVAQDADRQLDFIVLSGGVQSNDGTLLLVRRETPGGQAMMPIVQFGVGLITTLPP